MAKWADYCISAVQYDSNHTHIVKVKVREDQGEKLGPEGVWTREQVVSSIDSGSTFVTILMGPDNKWNKGAAVKIIVVDKVKYIRTDGNSKKADNLGELPEF